MISAQHLRSCRPPVLCVQILYSVLILWTKEMDGLSDFSNYLFRIINSQSAKACDGDLLLLRCPRHSTITIQFAFYGQSAALPGIVPGMRCQWRNHSCSATTALQKVLSECQGHRNCQFLVNHQVFGIDPCPGTPKYLHVSYRCKPTEHKKRITCEGDRLLLHCKYPKVLNIYSAVYGRQLEGEDLCPSEEQPPPFECLFHGAVDVVSNICYGKQRCLFTIDEEHFKNPCPPGTKKYITVLYACVPESLLKEADPSSFQTTSVPNQSTKEGERPVTRSSKFPENRIIVSNSLMAYGYITEHPEMAGLLFTSSVCVGLLIVLIAVSTQLTCSRHLNTTRTFRKTSRTTNLEEEEPMNQDNDEEEEDEDEKRSLMDSSNLSEVGKKVYCWEDVTYTTEAAELMERIERRELVIQEIRMNAYLNGNTCILHSYMPTITQNVQ
ncbi:protein eva-1 homolog C-like isoform X1 [Sinocyclocheilus rhinocerous]|uniref:Protein eva-1 homolog C-like n=1 Tax=Sinocyclocheilus rhinocerous TaxID=307959 RepID=A0A673LHA1_9TELE|nr:PREDICTED: protein eva-1 homolog C-like isoform X1 [Sinocyclocheilus rhinocerous]